MCKKTCTQIEALAALVATITAAIQTASSSGLNASDILAAIAPITSVLESDE